MHQTARWNRNKIEVVFNEHKCKWSGFRRLLFLRTSGSGLMVSTWVKNAKPLTTDGHVSLYFFRPNWLTYVHIPSPALSRASILCSSSPLVRDCNEQFIDGWSFSILSLFFLWLWAANCTVPNISCPLKPLAKPFDQDTIAILFYHWLICDSMRIRVVMLTVRTLSDT